MEKQIEIFKLGDAQDQPSIQLTCEMVVPLLVEVVPRTLSWKAGEQFQAKEALITVAPGHKLKVLAPTFRHDQFETEFKVLLAGEKYVLRVLPKPGAEPQLQICSFSTDAKTNKYKRLRVYLKVSK